ncbi:MAG: UDP-2,3-diacylglucosamine diphosphatase [Bacteroidetes bacterium]|nr:UDP-2,3-diacylglucosamine diphosphatase [Bacteroidota bacterium]
MSDLHLGSGGAKAVEATEFLKINTCERLVLNGDIIDAWQLKKYGSWKKAHTGFFRVVLKMMEKLDTKVYYIRGNHDDFLDQVLPLLVGKNFQIRRDMILKSKNRKFLITHGDIFDSVTSKMKWLAHLGDYGYTFLLWLNKFYNKYRTFRGLPYYSLSQSIKQKVKAAVNFVSDFEEKLAELARSKNCDGVICGHIHQPAMKEIDGIIYMNSGDWVETMSALVEDFSGNWDILYFHQEKPSEKLKEAFNKELIYGSTIMAS